MEHPEKTTCRAQGPYTFFFDHMFPYLYDFFGKLRVTADEAVEIQLGNGFHPDRKIVCICIHYIAWHHGVPYIFNINDADRISAELLVILHIDDDTSVARSQIAELPVLEPFVHGTSLSRTPDRMGWSQAPGTWSRGSGWRAATLSSPHMNRGTLLGSGSKMAVMPLTQSKKLIKYQAECSLCPPVD
jgi:hypothetical protein